MPTTTAPAAPGGVRPRGRQLRIALGGGGPGAHRLALDRDVVLDRERHPGEREMLTAGHSLVDRGGLAQRSASATYPVAMARVLVTGMSGAGKSTLLAAVARRGYPTVDTDYDGWELAGALWDEPRMSALLSRARHDRRVGTDKTRAASTTGSSTWSTSTSRWRCSSTGCAPGPTTRTARRAEQQADITRYVAEVEPLIRRSATLELDGLLPVPDLADRVEHCLRSS